jgi:Holliday junction resolvasome RuvABC endonuclease subunit
MIVLGLDLSLRSPGIALYDTLTQEWKLRCFANLKREEQLVIEEKQLQVWNRMDTGSDVERYSMILVKITDFLKGVDVTDIVIEGYAFSKASAHSVKLHELCGIIKHWLHVTYPRATLTIYPPTMWRKRLHHNGHASKEDAVHYVETHVLPTIRSIFPNVSSPLTDICDAICLVAALHAEEAPSKKRKK